MNALIYVGHLTLTLIGVLAIVLIMRRHQPPRWMIALIAVVAVVFEVACLKLTFPHERFFDWFVAYYPAGQSVLRQDPAMLLGLIDKGVSGFVNIPVVSYLFAPFALLKRLPSVAIFTFIGIGLTVASWFLLVRLAGLDLQGRWLLALLYFANGPLLNGIKLGNTSYFLLFALAGGLALLRDGRSARAGALLAAAAIIKPPLILFGIFFLLRRDWRGAAAFALVGAAVATLSLALFGFADNLHWFKVSIVQFSHSWLAAFNVQSIPTFILRMSARRDLLSIWLPQQPTRGEQLLAQILIGALYVVAAAACVRRPSQAPARDGEALATSRLDLQYLLVICLALVSSPLTWAHYYVWLLMPMAFFLGAQPSALRSAPSRWLGWAAVALVTPIVASPKSIAIPSFLAPCEAIFYSLLAFGGLLWFGLIAWWLAQTGGLLSRPVEPVPHAA